MLKSHSKFWCRGANNKHHAGFQTQRKKLKTHSAMPHEFLILSVVFEPYSSCVMDEILLFQCNLEVICASSEKDHQTMKL